MVEDVQLRFYNKSSHLTTDCGEEERPRDWGKGPLFKPFPAAKYKTRIPLMTPLLLHTALFFQHCPAASSASALAVVHVFVSAGEGFTPLLQAELV